MEEFSRRECLNTLLLLFHKVFCVNSSMLLPVPLVKMLCNSLDVICNFAYFNDKCYSDVFYLQYFNLLTMNKCSTPSHSLVILNCFQTSNAWTYLEKDLIIIHSTLSSSHVILNWFQTFKTWTYLEKDLIIIYSTLSSSLVILNWLQTSKTSTYLEKDLIIIPSTLSCSLVILSCFQMSNASAYLQQDLIIIHSTLS